MFTKYIISGAFLGVAGGAYYWLNAPRDHSHLSVDLMLDKLNDLDQNAIETKGTWAPARTFHHLAQSVEFSMNGFPIQKSPIFQKTAGKLAFKVFNAKGAMRHGLDQKIPGEHVDTEATDTQHAINRLQNSLHNFKNYSEDMKPHFAYGNLSKDDYAIAHVLHINNHLEEFNLV